jgi:hypothetical protein
MPSGHTGLPGYKRRFHIHHVTPDLNISRRNTKSVATQTTFDTKTTIKRLSWQADNFGRRVKVFGSKYRRHLGTPMRAVLKSNNIAQPTQIYLPYSFRVFSSISPEYRNLPALSVSARDYVGALSTCQARVTLVGNDIGLYERLSKNSAGLV